MPVASITRRIEFDAGHRIPDHKSKCRNVHGHRYVLEATLRGWISEQQGASHRGMVLDFGDLKEIMTRLVGEPWDHGFLVWRGDHAMLSALSHLDDKLMGSGHFHKTRMLDCIPTVENLVVLAAETLLPQFIQAIKLERVKLFETPNCWAEWVNPDYPSWLIKPVGSPTIKGE